MDLKMNVFSLFDGGSLAQLALQKANIVVNNYYASEIDISAITVTQRNFKNTVQVGDMTNLTKKYLKTLNIDLLVGGSSCIDLSSIGLTKGLVSEGSVEITSLKQYKKLKKKKFKFEGESYLFWEYVNILKILKPKYWVLENVKMPLKWLKVFEDALGVKGVLINSNLVIPQNRERYYFANFKIKQPIFIDSNIQDILDTNHNEVIATKVLHNGIEYGIGASIKPQIRTNIKNNINSILICKKDFHTMRKGVNSGWADNKVGLKYTPTLRAKNNATQILDVTNNIFRRVTPLERERLQGYTDNYTNSVSATQRVKITGNSFTVPIFIHIFKSMLKGKLK